MRVVSKIEAKKLGLYKYFTGEPCKNGHIAERYVSNTSCLACVDADKADFTNTQLMRTDKSVRQQAKENGEPFYKSVKPCKIGHTKRYTTSGNCVSCVNFNKRERRKVNRERLECK